MSVPYILSREQLRVQRLIAEREERLDIAKHVLAHLAGRYAIAVAAAEALRYADALIEAAQIDWKKEEK